MIFIMGVLIALGSAALFGMLGLLTLWGGATTLRTELPRDYVRTHARGSTRLTTLTLVGVPLVLTAVFAIIIAVRFLQVAFGMA